MEGGPAHAWSSGVRGADHLEGSTRRREVYTAHIVVLGAVYDAVALAAAAGEGEATLLGCVTWRCISMRLACYGWCGIHVRGSPSVCRARLLFAHIFGRWVILMIVNHTWGDGRRRSVLWYPARGSMLMC